MTHAGLLGNRQLSIGMAKVDRRLLGRGGRVEGGGELSFPLVHLLTR